MSLTPNDDFPHPRGSGESWQENYLFLGVDPEQDLAFFAHVARLPALGTCDIKIAVKIGDDVVSTTEHHPLGEGLDVPGLEFDVVDPWYSWRVKADGKGLRGGAPDLLLTTGRGDVPLSFDIRWDAKATPVVHSEGFAQMASAGAGSSGDHYIQGGTWSGTLRIGDREITSSGPSIRDHTWGERDNGKLQLCWWTPMVFDDGSYQLAGIDMHLVDGTRTSFSFEHDGNAQRTLPVLDVEITEGTIDDYSRAKIKLGDEIEVEATRFARMPIAYYRGGGVGWVSDDALCTLRTADGRTGFGIIEKNRQMTQDEIERLPEGSAPERMPAA